MKGKLKREGGKVKNEIISCVIKSLCSALNICFCYQIITVHSRCSNENMEEGGHRRMGRPKLRKRDEVGISKYRRMWRLKHKDFMTRLIISFSRIIALLS